MCEQAAEAIHQGFTDAKEKKRSVKIIFVCKTTAGRVDASDLMTVQKVLDSIKLPKDKPIPPNSFQILINKFKVPVWKYVGSTKKIYSKAY